MKDNIVLKNEIIFNERLAKEFILWLRLDLTNITWEGRYQSKFDFFWNELFIKQNPSIQDILLKFSLIKKSLKAGPVNTWVSWLRDKFLIFIFIKFELSIEEISILSKENIKFISLLFRDFFVDKALAKENDLNLFFQINRKNDEKIKLTYLQIIKNLGISPVLSGENNFELLNSLEITLYKDWDQANTILEKFFNKNNRVKIKFNRENNVRSKLRFVLEVCFMLGICFLVIYGLKHANRYYETYLTKKISLYEPNFFWLDKNLSFFNANDTKAKVDITAKELENLEDLENKAIFNEESIKDVRLETESDVVLSSIDSLPKDISVAENEQSVYEESVKGGYRDYRYGRRKAYRILLKSVDPGIERSKILDLLESYEVSQVDSVAPGTIIPGGVYFNLNVPLTNLKGFLEAISHDTEVAVFESTPRANWPSNMGRVFIWIKSI